VSVLIYRDRIVSARESLEAVFDSHYLSVVVDPDEQGASFCIRHRDDRTKEVVGLTVTAFSREPLLILDMETLTRLDGVSESCQSCGTDVTTGMYQ